VTPLNNIKIVLAVAIIGGSFYFGYQSAANKWEARVNKAEAKQTRLVLELERVQAGNAYLLEESLAESLNEQQIKKEVIYREVVKYREDPNADKCILPAEWVQISNSAAGLPGSTETTSGSDGTASDSQALIVVTDNYAICLKEIEKLKTLQEYARGVSE